MNYKILAAKNIQRLMLINIKLSTFKVSNLLKIMKVKLKNLNMNLISKKNCLAKRF